MAFNNHNNADNNSIWHGHTPPQPSLIQRNPNLQLVTSTISQFGTNTGTLHTQLLPNINANTNTKRVEVNNNNINRNDNNNADLNLNINNIDKTDNEPLREDVKRLKHKLREIVEDGFNFKESKRRRYFQLCTELDSIYTQEYLSNIEEKTTSAVNEDSDILIVANKCLAEITVLGQTLYLLSIHKLQQECNIEMAHKYIIRALMYWRCANKCAKRMGIENKSFISTAKMNKMDKIHVDVDDLGYFWPQLVQCYIAAGNVFLKNFEYDVTILMYKTALQLCHCMEGRFHFSCIDALEYLITVNIIRHDMVSAIMYCGEMMKILEQNSGNILIKNEYKFINTKALYSCLLRLSNNRQDVDNGCKLKGECIKECVSIFGETSGNVFNLYIYFIKHCIQHSAKAIDVAQSALFVEADAMINYLSNLFTIKRDLKYYEEYFVCQLFEEYLFIISQQAIMKYGINASSGDNNKNKTKKNKKHHHLRRLEMLYPLHIKHIENLNRNPMSKQYKLHNRNCTINKIKVIACYADTFEAYQDVNRANQLRQQINQQQLH